MLVIRYCSSLQLTNDDDDASHDHGNGDDHNEVDDVIDNICRQNTLDEGTEPWGVMVERVEVT